MALMMLEVHTSEPLVQPLIQLPSSLEVEIAIEKLKRYKFQQN
jgi:hypothetical protein